MKDKLSYAIRPDAQAFDEIRLKVIPRFKKIDLSGDEWRISVNVEFYRNGEKVHEEWAAHDMEHACGFLYNRLATATDNGHGYFAGDGIHCDQEGCDQKATKIFKIKKRFCVGGGKCGQEKESYGDQHRCFCDRHSRRGDSDLEDNDENYELVKIV